MPKLSPYKAAAYKNYANTDRYLTQKAKGLAWLRSTNGVMALKHTGFLRPPSAFRVLPYDEPELPTFARPCPMRPRHGFVESQLCTSWRQLMALVHATARADPEGEIILMPEIRGIYSLLINNSGTAIGKGNDGATSGTSALFIPAPTPAKALTEALMQGGYSFPSDVGLKQSPYIEAVRSDDARLGFDAVQLRDGPEISAASEYIPRKVKVRKVLEMSDAKGIDVLLEWEKMVLEASKKTGTVAYLPKHPLSSHFAIHAISHGVPVVTKKRPELGQTLPPAASKPPAMKKGQYGVLADLLAMWLLESRPPSKILWPDKTTSEGESPLTEQTIGTALAIAHSHMHWGGAWPYLHLRAFGAAITARAILCGCLGEARHFYGHGPGTRLIKAETGYMFMQNYHSWPTELDLEGRKAFNKEWQVCCEEKGLGYYLSARLHLTSWEKVGDGGSPVPNKNQSERLHYGDGFPRPTRDHIFVCGTKLHPRTLQELGPLLEEDLKGPGWGSSYGGARWAKSAYLGTRLLNAIMDFLEDPDRPTWVRVVRRMNTAVNSAHNGGDVLSKWAFQQKLDNIAQAPCLGFTASWLPELVYDRAYWNSKAKGKREECLAQPPKMKPIPAADVPMEDVEVFEDDDAEPELPDDNGEFKGPHFVKWSPPPDALKMQIDAWEKAETATGDVPIPAHPDFVSTDEKENDNG